MGGGGSGRPKTGRKMFPALKRWKGSALEKERKRKERGEGKSYLKRRERAKRKPERKLS